MERDFYNDDFEELIRQKADQYKMYPSDKVWKGVYSSLHTRRRKFVIGMSFLVTGILFLAGKELIMPGNHISSSKSNIEKTSTPDKQNQTVNPSNNTVSIPELKLQEDQKEVYAEGSIKPQEDNSSASAIPNSISSASVQPVVIVNEIYNTPTSAEENATGSSLVTANNKPDVSENKTNIIENFPIANDKNEDEFNAKKINLPLVVNIDISENTTNIPETSLIKSITKEESAENKKPVNWLEEFATYELKTPIKTSRLNWQLYITPGVSYRTLSGGDNYPIPKTGVQYVPIALAHYGSPDDFVNHRPAMSYEAGGSLIYKLTRNLSIKAGLQFDYNRYTIEAYSSSPQQATIALSSSNYYSPSMLTGYTNIQNFGGNSIAYLNNNYFQLSAPVGFELRVFGNGRLQFNIAATIQPTYLLNRNSYLLTTDYSDYTKAPSLFRRWNFNAGAEAFLSYKVGNLRWQIGPQFRYQILSTYTSNYPINENLKGYGLKIGVSKTIW
ncbi:MAG: hypothetical protein JST87_15865 [Bacteroidetes bacterium]|nr:hypothetical protein [Bacteroidota bacterium]